MKRRLTERNLLPLHPEADRATTCSVAWGMGCRDEMNQGVSQEGEGEPRPLYAALAPGLSSRAPHGGLAGCRTSLNRFVGSRDTKPLDPGLSGTSLP